MTASALAFHGTTFDIVDRNGHPWLRAHQIGVALDYKRPDIIAKLYRANAAEFTDSMTAVVKLPTAGGMQDVRIFSLRGAHLLGMFARTPKAAEFRRWVLDVLDAQTQPAAIDPCQAQALRDIVQDAVLQISGRPSLLPAAQRKEVEERLLRLSQLFHPMSEQAADVIGIGRALRGIHPRMGAKMPDYVKVLPPRP